MTQRIRAYYIDVVTGKRRGVLEALFCFLLLLLSFVYGFFVRLVLAAYQEMIFKSSKPDCRVISVGNITWGGTAKTALVELLARFLKQQGRNPAILIRGYGQDEVDMLKEKFKDIPVLAGRNRVKTAKQAKRRYAADVLILDDGFQHWRLKRDLDIVLIDVGSAFGNGRLLPRGILREPLSSLRRADVFVLTKTNLAKENIEPIKQKLNAYNPQAPIFEANYAPCSLRNLASGKVLALEIIENQRIGLVAGIAAPESFAKNLSLLGARICLRFEFPDHHRYSKEDLQTIEARCLKNQIDSVITTEKDAPKLAVWLESKKLTIDILVLGVELKITKDEAKFFSFIVK